MSGPPVESGGLATQSGNDIKEAIWFAVVACIAMLVLIILYQAGPIIGLHAGTDEATTPAVFWILIVVCLSLCAFVPFLLKNSKPMDFKIIAILLTAAVPAVIIAFLLFSLWRAAGPVTYTQKTNTLFLDFAGMRVSTQEDVDRIRLAVEAKLKPIGRRVVSIANYDSFWVHPDIAEEYMDFVRHVEDTYYLKVSRYTTNGFMRIKLSRGLEERRITSNVVQNYVEATRSLDED